MTWNTHNKFGAVKVKCDGMTFASKMEHKRYLELKALVAAGSIEGLVCQPKFEAKINGKRVCSIILDFQYFDKGVDGLVYEDVKGHWPPISRLKFKILKALYPDVDVRQLTAR